MSLLPRIRHPRLLLGGLTFGALLVAALFAPWLGGQDPMAQSLLDQLLPPAWSVDADPRHLLGTDNLGRDVLSRLIHGARPAVIVMLLGAAASGLVGTVLGLLAGYFGGVVDAVVSRVVEIFMSFPQMLLAIVLVAVVGPGLGAVVCAVALVGWTRFCRVIRGEAKRLRELDFVLSARTLGVGALRILWHELLPNLLPVLSVLFALEMGRAIIVEVLLSFIGFSASDVPTWGGMIADGRAYINQGWWVMAIPILVVGLSVLGLNALGDGLREAVDPLEQQ
ncbi:MAG TPA: ABC transporter permease [Burkholderiaceae bacterium]|nr:ABC transporter permease [Burkholderiaceae bacterium]